MTLGTRPLALVTGATQGIGLAVARQLARQHSYHVLLGVRDVETGTRIADELKRDGHQASVVELDLTVEQSIDGAIKAIERDHGYLDVLVNNAGTLLDNRAEMKKWDLYQATFVTNVIGAGVLTEGLVPLLSRARSGPPRVVFVSSRMGSLALSLDKTTNYYAAEYKVYDASKAAVNMLAVEFARVLDGVGGKSNAVCPGLISTALTGHTAYGESPELGAVRIVEMATLGQDGPTGTFSDRGGVVPW